MSSGPQLDADWAGVDAVGVGGVPPAGGPNRAEHNDAVGAGAYLSDEEILGITPVGIAPGGTNSGNEKFAIGLDGELHRAGARIDGQKSPVRSQRLLDFYRALVASADREWERSHSYLFIHDLQRRAAAHLGMDKEWHYQVRETAECPGCGERLKPGVAVCKSCGAILDREKAATLGLGVGLVAAASQMEKVAESNSARPSGRRQ
jgi:hypothetical protein